VERLDVKIEDSDSANVILNVRNEEVSKD